jgi:hypothetical protein
MPMLQLQSIPDLFVAGDAQLGRVTTRPAAFERHAAPAVRSSDDMARTASTSRHWSVHDAFGGYLDVATGARRSIAGGDGRVLGRRRHSGGLARSLRNRKRLGGQGGDQKHESRGGGH